MCNDAEGLKQYKKKLLSAIEHGTAYPMEADLPPIYITGNKEIDLSGEFGEPYYSEIDINVITSTNTSSCEKVYSNYERVIRSVRYIKEKKCKPIAVLKEGEKYYIENGKHRFLAYTLLGERIIPVSIREKDFIKSEKTYSIVEYKRNLYNDDGSDISYPEKAIDFFDRNENLFQDIVRIEMKCLEEYKRYCLKLTRQCGDVIEFKNGISAGNEFRSSEVVKEIICRCGYDMNMEFIKANSQFMLESKYDAHNIDFDTDIVLNEQDRQYIVGEVSNIHYYQYDSEKVEDKKIGILHRFLAGYKGFETTYAYQTLYNSGILYNNEKVYYLVGSDSLKGEENYIYIFSDKKIQESNLEVEYKGRIGKGDSLYENISNQKALI